uniref:SAP domain-containing protein n=1 Tax=Globodera rostochiensis TaxID=31243 RepID=A0A914I943_GLORO
MSFGQKPNAWARPQGTSQPQQLNPNLFMATAGQAFSTLPGMPINSGLLVNQAAFTNMNNVLAQAQRQMLPQQLQPPQQQQRATPTNTQPNRSQHEDVFFQTNVIRGSIPRVGDRVMVEANFNPSMPFKWNARSIEKIQNVEYRQETAPQHTQQYQPLQNRQVQQQNGNSSRWNDRTSRDEFPRESRRQAPLPAHRTPPRDAIQKRPLSRLRSPLPRRSPARRQETTATKREREVRDEVEGRERDRDSGRVRSPQSSKRDTASPPRRRQRIIPRYHCNVPKQTLHSGELKYAELRKRYTSLYIPSDFIRCKLDWIESIKLETPLQFSPHPIKFHVLHKDVDVPLGEGEQLPVENPSDADNRFVVKVLLISHPGLTALRRKLSGLMPDGSIDESTETQPLSKNIQILVGYRGKGEFMCIGGAWSPSLDGTNPLDPKSIVKTAIRTTLSLTGIDLSRCAKWYKMLHLHYFRPERSRVDSCVLMLPDTSTIPDFQLTVEQYQQAEQKFQEQLATKLSAIDAEEFVPPNQENEKGLNSGSDDGVAFAAKNSEETNSAESDSGGADQSAQQPDVGDHQQTESTNTSAVEAQDETEATVPSESTANKNLETHWSILEQNVKAMKVAELRDELEARQLESKGVKNVLMQRLQEAIEKEKAKDRLTDGQQNDSAAENAPSDTAVTQQKQSEVAEKQSIVVQIKEEIIELMETDEAGDKTDEKGKESKTQDDKKIELENNKPKFEKEKKERKLALERHYNLIPKNEPGIFVYPSKTAKAGRFDCKLMSFHSLLEYNKEHDNKEASFEVFLFVEALKEMFDRANAFVVYHTVSTALEREVEKKRRNEALSEACKNDEVVVLVEGTNNSKEEKTETSKSPINADLRSNFKALVHNFEVLIAFAHFDTNICGYIADKDLEDIIYSTGLDERVNYRDFTDKWVDKEGRVKYVPAPSYENLFQSLVEYAKGHKASNDHMENSFQNNEMSDPKLISESEFVYYGGSLINIKQSVERQYALEKERQETVDKNEKLTLQLNAINEQREHLDKKKRRLEDDVDRYKKKLYDTEKQLKKEQEDNASMKNSLVDCKRYGERIVAVVEKVLPQPPKKEEKDKPSGPNKNGTGDKGNGKDGGDVMLTTVDKLLAKVEENSVKKRKVEEASRLDRVFVYPTQRAIYS